MQLLRGACHPDVEARAILEMTPLREASDRARCANTDSERRSVTDAFGQEVRQIYAPLMGAPTCVVIYICADVDGERWRAAPSTTHIVLTSFLGSVETSETSVHVICRLSIAASADLSI